MIKRKRVLLASPESAHVGILLHFFYALEWKFRMQRHRLHPGIVRQFIKEFYD